MDGGRTASTPSRSLKMAGSMSISITAPGHQRSEMTAAVRDSIRRSGRERSILSWWNSGTTRPWEREPGPISIWSSRTDTSNSGGRTLQVRRPQNLKVSAVRLLLYPPFPLTGAMLFPVHQVLGTGRIRSPRRREHHGHVRVPRQRGTGGRL